MAIVTQAPPAPRTAGISRYRRPDRDFVIVANSFARSKYSARAVKVGLYVLSHTEDYVLTQARIASEIDLSLRTVQAALDDLESYGLLIRHDVRDQRGHRVGTRMHVKDEPFTDVERADLYVSLSAESAHAESAHADSAPPKKTTSKKKIKKPEDPSGGTAPADPPAVIVSEEAMAKSATQEPALFEVPAPEPEHREPTAKDVTAAYVDSYRATFSRDPLPRDIGRVARDAKQMITTGQATVLELTSAATALGKSQWANLGQELKFSRSGGRSGGNAPGMAPTLPSTAPEWDTLSQTYGLAEDAWGSDQEAAFKAVASA